MPEAVEARAEGLESQKPSDVHEERPELVQADNPQRNVHGRGGLEGSEEQPVEGSANCDASRAPFLMKAAQRQYAAVALPAFFGGKPCRCLLAQRTLKAPLYRSAPARARLNADAPSKPIATTAAPCNFLALRRRS